MKVAIVKYNAGNIASVQNALSRLGVESVVTDDAGNLSRGGQSDLPGCRRGVDGDALPSRAGLGRRRSET